MFEYLINMPAKILFGAGKISELGSMAASFGKKVFLLYDPFLKDTETIGRIKADLDSCHLSVTEYHDVLPNPRNTAIDQAIDLCRSESCDVVVGIGGGSAIDSAKAVAIVSINGGKCWDYTERANEQVWRPQKGKLPLIVAPTTSGTGTEATLYSVINNTAIHFKADIMNDLCFPTAAIVDPELTVSMPPLLTALSGIDAFAHAFESFVNKNSTPYSEIIALASMKLFVENIEECCKNGKNLVARTNMALASTLGGLAIAHSPTTMPHAVGQPLSGLYDVSHGGSIAACIGEIIKWTLPYGEKKFARIAELFDQKLAGLPDPDKAERLPAMILDLFDRIMGGNQVTMRSFGLQESQIELLAEMAFTCYFLDCSGHPRTPVKADLVEIYRRCMSAGRSQ